MPPLILDNVTKRFGSHSAVENLSLQVASGEFVALLGPSGCGKTTMLRLLAGFERLSEGCIRLGERTLADSDCHLPPERRDMGMVFQAYALWPHMSVADNVGYPLKLRGVRGAEYRDRVHRALGMVSLEPYAERRPRALSGGQRQRVALARCLVSEPAVVLLDEPLANLDRHLRATMEEGFREFHRRCGATMVYVTHDQGEAMALADRVAVMRDGRLEQWATPEALYRQPRNAWVADFIGRGNVLELPGGEAGQALDGSRLMALAADTTAPRHQPVLVRPEHVHLGDSGLAARVTGSVFRGERYEVALELANGVALQAYASSAPARGSTVKVTLSHGWGLEPR